MDWSLAWESDWVSSCFVVERRELMRWKQGSPVPLLALQADEAASSYRGAGRRQVEREDR